MAEPMYRQIADDLHRQIETGEPRPGEQLRTEIEFRDIYSASPETGFFRLPDDGRISVIEIRQTAFDEQGTPVRLTVNVYPADRNQFAVNVGEVLSTACPPTELAEEQGTGAQDDARDGTG